MTDQTEALERIWAVSGSRKHWQDEPPASGLRTGQWVEYTRKDLSDAKDKRIAELESERDELAERIGRSLDFINADMTGEAKQELRTTLSKLKGTDQ